MDGTALDRFATLFGRAVRSPRSGSRHSRRRVAVAIVGALAMVTGLAGSATALLGPLEDDVDDLLEWVAVEPDGTESETPVLPADTYRIVARGTWDWGDDEAGDPLVPSEVDGEVHLRADAECATSDLVTWNADHFGADTNGGTHKGDLLVNDASVHWSPTTVPTSLGCDPAHHYEAYLTLDSPGTIGFRILDPTGNPGDNEGSLKVSVAPISNLHDPSTAHQALAAAPVARHLATVRADVTGGSSSIDVDPWSQHFLVTKGLYYFNGFDRRDLDVADAECSQFTTGFQNGSVLQSRFRPEPQSNRSGSNQDFLDLYVQDRPLESAGPGTGVAWAPARANVSGCDYTHTYTATFVTEGSHEKSSPLRFSIVDEGGYQDNGGALLVHVFETTNSPADNVVNPVQSAPADLAGSVSIDASDASPASLNLAPGTYRVLADGTWADGAAPGAALDVECLRDPATGSGAKWPDGSLQWLRNNTGDATESETAGDVRISVAGDDVGAVHWVPDEPTHPGCDETTHRYETYVQVDGSTSSTVAFTLEDLDGNAANNTGTLDIDVYSVTTSTLPESVDRYVGTVAVNSANPNPTGIKARNWAQYFVLAQGTWKYRPLAEADSACRAAWEYGSRGNAPLAVNGVVNVPWKPTTGCQADSHTYWNTFVPEWDAFDMLIADGPRTFEGGAVAEYGDNVGFAFVQVFEQAPQPADTAPDPVESAAADLVGSVSLDTSSGTPASLSLAPGTYRVLSEGTWSNGAARLDTECLANPATGSSAIWPDRSLQWLRNGVNDAHDFDTDGEVRISVGGTPVEHVHWVPDEPTFLGCDETDHRYETYVQVDGSTSTVAFTLDDLDATTSNNSGTLDIDVYEVTPDTLPDAVTSYVGTVAVNSATSAVVGIPSDRWSEHLLVAQGTYQYERFKEADAACTRAWAYSPGSRGAASLRVDNIVPTAWSPGPGCQATSHTYWRNYTPEWSFVDFMINDNSYGNNRGFLYVQVFVSDPLEDTVADAVSSEPADLVGSVNLDSSSSSPASLSLAPGTYRVLADGTWTDGAFSGSKNDVECGIRPTASQAKWPDQKLKWFRNFANDAFDKNADGDVTISVGGQDSGPVHWVPRDGTHLGCDDHGHEYETYVQVDGSTSTVEFALDDLDGNTANNSGTLGIDVYEVTADTLPDTVTSYVGTLALNAEDDDPVRLRTDTRWAEHLLVAQGAWQFESFKESDGACTSGWANNPAGRGAAPIRVFGQVQNWNPTAGCQGSSHTYWTTVVPEGVFLDAVIKDNASYVNNKGFVFVQVFEHETPADTVPDPVDSLPADLEGSVSLDTSSGSPASLTLPQGAHRVIARGTWSDGAASLDVECLADPATGSGARWPDGSLQWLRNRAGDQFDLNTKGDVRISVAGSDVGPVHWVPTDPSYLGCNEPTHEYETYVQVDAASASVAFSVDDLDSNTANNAGTLAIDVYEVTSDTLPTSVTRYVGSTAVNSRSVHQDGAIVPATAGEDHLLVAQGAWQHEQYKETDSACNRSWVYNPASKGHAPLRVGTANVLEDPANPTSLTGWATANPWRPTSGCQGSNSTYWRTVAPLAGNLKFLIADGSRSNNTGFLFVQVFESGSAPLVSADVSSITFGGVEFGSTGSPETVTLSNSGTETLTMSGTAISGTHATSFTRTADGCTGQNLAPGDDCTVSVAFSPKTTGSPVAAQSATLTVSSNASNGAVTVDLSGTPVDTTAAVATWTTPNNQTRVSTVHTVTGTVSDLGGAAFVEVVFIDVQGNETQQPSSLSNCTATYTSCTFTANVPLLAPGPYTVRARGGDVNGNVQSPGATVNIVVA